MSVFDTAWDIAKQNRPEWLGGGVMEGRLGVPEEDPGTTDKLGPMVDVATEEGDECCEKVRAEFKDYLTWATGHGDKNAEVIGWLVDTADCESLYALLENTAHAHPRARQFLQMWDDCSSGKNAEGME